MDAFKLMDDLEKLEELEICGLMPENYLSLFDNPNVAYMDEEQRELYEAGIDPDEYEELDDVEKIKVLEQHGLDPEDYLEICDDSDESEPIEEFKELADAGINVSDFKCFDDVGKCYELELHGIDPMDYIGIFENPDVIGMNEDERELYELGVDIEEFRLLDDLGKKEALKECDIDPEEYRDVFDNPDVIIGTEGQSYNNIPAVDEYQEHSGNESKDAVDSTNFYEEQIFRALGLDLDTLRWGTEEQRRKILVEKNLSYDEFKNYFFSYDISQKWRNRNSNDMSLLSEILKEMSKNPPMKNRGVKEWTNGEITIKFEE